MRKLIDRWLMASWVVVPLAYAALFTYLGGGSPLTASVLDDAVIALGGLAGLVGGALLLRREGEGRWPVLAAGLTWLFGAAFLRGTALALDALLVPPIWHTAATFMLHLGSFIVFAFGLLVLSGVAPTGRRLRLLRARVRSSPWSSGRDDEAKQGDE